uniref:Protein kinase domain-containing protein n=1 Tax=Heterorhabditis bacteriophora TaxID=37862 RepID=A0A1I7WK83_HETBA
MYGKYIKFVYLLFPDVQCLERSSHVREVTQQHRIPRPFFILEKLEPSLETVMNANKNAYMGVGTAVYLTIGCIKSMNTQFYALRLLHMKGICHRNVQPAHFALRLPPEGMLKRSADTMAGKDSTSVDDLVSCIYMLTKFILGYVPWHLETEKQAIINCKKNVESWDYVEDELHNKLLVNNNKIYAILKRSNGFTIPVDYEDLYAQLLHNVSNFPIDHSLFGFSNNLLEEYDNISAEKFRYERNNYEYHLPRRNKKSNAFKTKSANHSSNKSERRTGRAKSRVKIPIPSVTVNKKSVPMHRRKYNTREFQNRKQTTQIATDFIRLFIQHGDYKDEQDAF